MPTDADHVTGTTAHALITAEDLPQRDAETLLLSVLGKDRAWLFSRGDDLIDQQSQVRFLDACRRRRAGEPIAYILGEWEFWSLPLTVTPDVLIPRPDTELLVQWALELIANAKMNVQSCLDLGTGSGAVALALKKEHPDIAVTAVDVAPGALNVARKNGAALNLEVEWLFGDWLEPLGIRKWPLILSNPPYISSDDPHLTQGDLPAEPNTALVSGPDGLDDIRQIVADSVNYLEAGGWLCLEHGWKQGEAVRLLFDDTGFEKIQTRRDLAGHERVTGGRW